MSRRAQEVLARARSEGALPRATRQRLLKQLESRIALGDGPVMDMNLDAPVSPPSAGIPQFAPFGSQVLLRVAIGLAAASGAFLLWRPPDPVPRLADAPISTNAAAPVPSEPQLPSPAPDPGHQGSSDPRLQASLASKPVDSPTLPAPVHASRPPAAAVARRFPRPTLAAQAPQPPAASPLAEAEPTPQPEPESLEALIERSLNLHEPRTTPAPNAVEAPESTTATAPEEPPEASKPPPPAPVRKRAERVHAPGLAEELKLLAAAQSALRAGLPERALAQLAEHAWRFPEGQLADSRDVARVLALCRLGKLELSRAEADKFLRRRPNSPFATRVRSCH